jgi:hypothetical protein
LDGHHGYYRVPAWTPPAGVLAAPVEPDNDAGASAG